MPNTLMHLPRPHPSLLLRLLLPLPVYHSHQVLITSAAHINRAIADDLVIVEILPPSMWSSPSAELLSSASLSLLLVIQQE